MSVGLERTLTKHFETISDPRVDRGRNHNLIDLMFITLTAFLCGANGWSDVERFAKGQREWFERFIELKFGVPSHDTIGRVFARLDPAELFDAMYAWVNDLGRSLQGKAIAIDGKTLRGSFNKAAGKSSLHTISAFATEARTCLRMAVVDGKSNEIPSVQEMLELLELAGATVTADAMHCQIKTARKIIRAGGDYVFIVKGNQKQLYNKLRDLFEEYGNRDYKVRGLHRQVTHDKLHGRTERREYYVIRAPKGLSRWWGLKSIGMVHRTREVNGKTSHEIVYFISSHPPKVKMLSEFVRGHWSIENRLHWVLDVTFSEDSSRIVKDSGPAVAAIFRRMSLNILQQDTSLKETIRGKRLRAGWDDTVRNAIFSRISIK